MSLLNGELDVLHIVEVVFKSLPDLIQLFIYLRHSLFERLEVFVLVCLGSLVERVRCADTGYDILSLSVDEPFSVELVVSVGRVT